MNNYPNDPTTGHYPPPGYPPQGYGPPQQPGYPPPYPQQPMPPGYPPMMPQQPMQPPKKKSKALWIVLGIIGVVVLCSVIANAGKSGSSTTTSSVNTTSSQPEPTQPPAAPKTWQTTHTYTGNGDQQTETFTIGNDWKIQWNCKGISGMDAPLYVSIYNADTNSLADWSAVSTSCKSTGTTGETTEHGGGNLYLKIISGIDWSITIQEQK